MTSRARLLVGVLVTALAAGLAAVLVIAWVVRGGDGSGAAVDYSAVAPVPEGIATGCPPPGRDLPYPADGVLPDGAVAVRLCNGPPQRTETGAPVNPLFDAPGDVLTTNVADLVALVNGLEPVVTKGRLCYDTGGSNYVYWFLYPGGDARAVLFNPGGCEDTLTAPDRRVGGGQALAGAFRQGLLAERADQTPPGTQDAAGCNPNDAPMSPIATPGVTDFATITYCVITGPQGNRYREGHLSGAQVGMVNRDIRAGRSPGPCVGRSFTLIRGLTVWGDRVWIGGTCHRYRLGKDTWTPSPAVVRMLDGLSLGPPEKQCTAFLDGHRNRDCPHW